MDIVALLLIHPSRRTVTGERRTAGRTSRCSPFAVRPVPPFAVRQSQGILTELRQHRLQRLPDNRRGELARGVVRAGAAALVGRLEHQAASRHRGRCGVPGDALVERREQLVQRAGVLQAAVRLACPVVAGGVGEPLAAVPGWGGEQRLEVDHHRRGDLGFVLALADDGDGRAGHPFEREAHDGLVDRADLLDVEGAVGEPFAVEDQQVAEDALQAAVGEAGERRLVGGEWRMVGIVRARLRSLFAIRHAPHQERVPLGVEQVTLTRRHRQLGVAAAAVDRAEQGHELGPAAVALVHRVGVALAVGAQPLEQAVDRVVAQVERRARQQAAVFGVEQEHQAHQHRQQAGVDRVRVVAQRLGQQLAVGRRVGRLEAAQQLVQRFEHLTRQGRGDLALVVATPGQQRRQPRRPGPGEQAPDRQQQVECANQRPAGDFGQMGDRPGQAARTLAARRVDQAQVTAVAEHADGDPGLAQQPLAALAGRRRPGGLVAGRRRVQAGRRGDLLDQHERHPCLFAGVHKGQGRREDLLEVRQRHDQAVGHWTRWFEAEQALLWPAQELADEARAVGDGRDGLGAGLDLGDVLQEALLQLGGVAVQDDLRIDQSGGGDDQPVGLEVPEPGLVVVQGGIVGHGVTP
ncbi:MAG: hypothetical protein IT204_19040 [Fimbriimonadaceae bacterium]|nr:hypothetical protein [Fimbriimonadaceae bacterium]